MSDSKGVLKFKEGFNCAQSVIYNYNEMLDVPVDTALKLASGFGAGIARTQNICGAISGGVLVLNSIYGTGENNNPEIRDKLYKKIQLLTGHFEKEYQTVICKDLLVGCGLLTKAGQKRFGEEKMINRCYGYVDKIISILDEIIEE